MAKSTVQKYLKILNSVGLVKKTKGCKWIFFTYLSAELPGRICVTVSGRDFMTSSHVPPRNVNPKLWPSFSNWISTRLHNTENVVWAES